MSDNSTIAAALVAARKDMPAVPKTAKAVYGNYATLDDIIAKTKDVLRKHGLTIVQMPCALDNGAPGLRTTILHESGGSVSATMPLLLSKPDMQQLGAALTYGRRYAWAAALGIASEHDDDAQGLVAEPMAGAGAKPTEQPVSRTPADTGESASATSHFKVPDAVLDELDKPKEQPTDGGKPALMVLEFSKHKGQTLGWVKENDPGFLKWLAGPKFDPQNPHARRIRAGATELLAA